MKPGIRESASTGKIYLYRANVDPWMEKMSELVLRGKVSLVTWKWLIYYLWLHHAKIKFGQFFDSWVNNSTVVTRDLIVHQTCMRQLSAISFQFLIVRLDTDDCCKTPTSRSFHQTLESAFFNFSSILVAKTLKVDSSGNMVEKRRNILVKTDPSEYIKMKFLSI